MGTNATMKSMVLLSALCSLSAALVPIPYNRGAQVVFTRSNTPNVQKIPEPGIKLFRNVHIPASIPVVQAAPAVYAAPAPVAVSPAAPAVYAAPAPVAVAPTVYAAPAPIATVVAEAPSPLDAPNPPM